MGLYRDVLLPRLCHCAMRNRMLMPYRSRVVSAAEGRVLEIGVGSGLNFPLYTSEVREIIALEPAPTLIAMARTRASRSPSPIRLIEGSAERIPLDDGSMDTIVSTWTLCTIPDVARALRDIRRVLKPGGSLLFVEHGAAPDRNVRKWQDRLTPAWKRISGGCHLNRSLDALIEEAGFRVDRLDCGYAAGPKFMTYFYEGSARSA